LKIIFILLFIGISNTYLIGQSISAMTYNIRYDNPKDGDNWWQLRKPEVVKLINHYTPDFLGIQEGLNTQVEYISEHSPQYDYIGVGRDDGKKKGEYTALYFDSSRFELIEEETFWLSESPDKISVGWDASMERICTYGHFVDRSTQVSYFVFNAHFDHRGPLAREESAKLIVNKIRELKIQDENLIVMGDFNCLPDSKPIAAFKTELDDTAALSATDIYGPDGTFNQFDPTFVPVRRIDYIFTKNLKVHSYRIVDDRRINNLWPSDHLPVMVVVK